MIQWIDTAAQPFYNPSISEKRGVFMYGLKLGVRTFIALLLYTSLGACSPNMRITRIGKELVALPENCPIEFKVMDANQASAQYIQVATISIEYDQENKKKPFPPAIKSELRSAACQLGGHLVIPLRSADDWVESMATYLVLARQPKRTGKPRDKK